MKLQKSKSVGCVNPIIEGKKTMRVVFLSSAYFSYVHVYTFDPDTIDASAYDAADQARHAHRTAVVSVEARPTPKTGRTLIGQLTAWLGRGKEGATC
jgi:hypothetical protein